MRTLRTALIIAASFIVAFNVRAIADYIYTDSNGPHTVFSWTCQTIKLCTGFSLEDNTGTNAAAVKANSTPAAQTDPALIRRNPDLGTIGDSGTSGQWCLAVGIERDAALYRHAQRQRGHLEYYRQHDRRVWHRHHQHVGELDAG